MWVEISRAQQVGWCTKVRPTSFIVSGHARSFEVPRGESNDAAPAAPQQRVRGSSPLSSTHQAGPSARLLVFGAPAQLVAALSFWAMAGRGSGVRVPSAPLVTPGLCQAFRDRSSKGPSLGEVPHCASTVMSYAAQRRTSTRDCQTFGGARHWLVVIATAMRAGCGATAAGWCRSGFGSAGRDRWRRAGRSGRPPRRAADRSRATSAGPRSCAAR
jgi:hypothetical protein